MKNWIDRLFFKACVYAGLVIASIIFTLFSVYRAVVEYRQEVEDTEDAEFLNGDVLPEPKAIGPDFVDRTESLGELSYVSNSAAWEPPTYSMITTEDWEGPIVQGIQRPKHGEDLEGMELWRESEWTFRLDRMTSSSQIVLFWNDNKSSLTFTVGRLGIQ